MKTDTVCSGSLPYERMLVTDLDSEWCAVYKANEILDKKDRIVSYELKTMMDKGIMLGISIVSIH